MYNYIAYEFLSTLIYTVQCVIMWSFSPKPEKTATVLVTFPWWLSVERFCAVMITAELLMSSLWTKTRLTGDQKVISDLSGFNSLASHSCGHTLLFSGASYSTVHWSHRAHSAIENVCIIIIIIIIWKRPYSLWSE